MDFSSLFLLFLLVSVGGPILLLVLHIRLRGRLARLEQQTGELLQRIEASASHAPEEASLAPSALAAPPPAPAPARPAAASEPPRSEHRGAWAGAAVAEEPDAPARETLGSLFERLVGGRLLIWIGAAALAIAGLFLIRYSIDFVTPGARMIAAACFGIILIGAGEYARAGRRLADDPRLAQALVGAGITVLYASAYGAHMLYGLIGIGSVSAAMLGVTFAALVLALRHGAATALIGLTGGFLTPLLVGDPDAGAVPLLAYLALLNAGIFSIAWRRGWTWLAAAAVVLSFLWAGALLFAPARDAIAAGLFVVALSIGATLARPGGGRELRLMRPAAIGLVQLAILVARTDLGIAAWSLFGALAAAGLALAWFRREYRLFPPLALALALLLLLAKANIGADPLAPAVAAGISLLFAAFALPRIAAGRDRLVAAVTATGAIGLPMLILRMARPELLDPTGWGLLAAMLALALAGLAFLQRGHAQAEGSGDPGLLAAAAGAALLAGLAAFDLLPADLVASAWLAIAIGIALAARRIGDAALPLLAAAAALAATARAMLMVPELWETLLLALVGEPALASALPGVADAWWALIAPAALLLAAWRFLPDLGGRPRAGVGALAGLFLLLAAYILFKQAFGLADRADFVARGFAERTAITQILFLAGWLLAGGRLATGGKGGSMDKRRMRRIGEAVTLLATARLVWFDLLLHNPALADQAVGSWPVLNLLAPAYLLSAFWLYAARRRARAEASGGFWLVLALAALVAGVALMVRQAFQATILTGPQVPVAEFYGYSLAGLLLSAALLAAAQKLGDKAMRVAALLLLSATAVKVFMIDAAALEGVLQILSFLGLGVALIGIGTLYGAILRAERAERR